MVSRPGPLRPALPDPLAGGVVRPILCHPDPALREICQPSGYLGGAELARLAADLLATMYAALSSFYTIRNLIATAAREESSSSMGRTRPRQTTAKSFL